MKPRYHVAFLLGALANPFVPGQTAPIPPPNVRDDQPIVLAEFRVDTSKNRGYVATNATTGTRLNMPIKDIPLPVEVITREFIDDIGAVDIKESLRYSAGIMQDTVTTANNFTFSPSGTGNAGSISRDSVQKKEATDESTLYVDPATGALVAPTVAGARQITVPERAVRYYDPISFRLTAGTSF